MNKTALPGLAAIALLVAAIDAVAECRSVATAAPAPPASEHLYPARLVRVDGRVADPAPQQEMFEGLRLNDGMSGSRVIFSTPPADPAMDTRRSARLEPGRQVLLVIEGIPNDALPSTAVSARRRAGGSRPKELVLDVVSGQEYAIAARLVPDQATRTLSNAHWEPVVWRQRALDCQ
jgi:hypothetical protein